VIDPQTEHSPVDPMSFDTPSFTRIARHRFALALLGFAVAACASDKSDSLPDASGDETAGNGGSAGRGDGAALPAGLIIDTHTHYWDTMRAPPPGRTMAVPFSNGKTVLPDDYKKVAAVAGISGAMLIEASGWVEDNEWALELAGKNPILVGVIGNLGEVMGTAKFQAVFDKLSADPLYRGVRLGAADDLAKAAWKGDLTMLADKGLAVDVNANGAAAVNAVAMNAKIIPTLKIVLDHAGYMPFTVEPTADWIAAMDAAAASPNVFCKVSRFQEQAATKAAPMAPTDVEAYRKVLDLLWTKFGADRLMFGSNWPLSDSAGTVTDAVKIMKAYFDAKGADASAKFFARNSKAVYKWVER